MVVAQQQEQQQEQEQRQKKAVDDGQGHRPDHLRGCLFLLAPMVYGPCSRSQGGRDAVQPAKRNLRIPSSQTNGVQGGLLEREERDAGAARCRVRETAPEL